MAGPQPINPGDNLAGIPSEGWNAFVETWKRVMQAAGPGNGPGASGGARRLTAMVENTTGADIDVQFGVLELDGPVFNTDDRATVVNDGIAFKGKTPTASVTVSNIAILQSPAPVGAFVDAVLVGPSWCDVNVTNASHTHATPTNGVTIQLTSGTSGLLILWKPSGTGIKRTLVQVGGGAAVENFRLIRGQAVGAVLTSDPDFYIDNVVVLSGGLDPSGGNPATQVIVQNIFSQAYSDNEMVDAVYSPEVATGVDWETLKASAGSEQYRLIRGLTKGAVTAQATSFTADNIVPWANGLDPVSGNAATELTIQKTQKEAFLDNTPFVAVHDGTNWVLVIVERYRAIHGTYYSTPGAGYAAIKLTAILENGLDPRTDPTDADEQVVVKLPTGTTFSGSDLVWADYAPGIGTSGGSPVNWLARPKATAGSGNAITVKISGQISARSGTTRGSGTAQPVDSATLANDGGTITVYNLSGNTYEGGVSGGPLYCLAHLVNGDYFIDPTDLRSISSFANNYYLGAQSGLPNWRAFQTDTIDGTAECVEGVITITIDPDTFVIPAS